MKQLGQSQVRNSSKDNQNELQIDEGNDNLKQVSFSRLHTPYQNKNRNSKDDGSSLIGQFCILILSVIFFMFVVGSVAYSFSQLNNQVKETKPKIINTIFVGFQSSQKVIAALESFNQYNDYPLHTMIAIVKQMPKRQFTKKLNTKIKWVVCECNQPKQLYSKLDDVVKMSNYEYLFYFDHSWKFQRQGFINQSIRLLQKFPRVQQVLLQNQLLNFNFNQTTASKNTGMIGFSFAAGLHRRQDLTDLPGGFSKFYAESVNENTSIQKKLSQYFLLKYMYALCGNTSFAKKI